ncbi:MAG: hypothetical protein G01um101456_501 [Parcubacteria group bacterium Gr01-1014_56]|nr:MAG: hypothetical protein G01um101456_501 [Parcubacteria group bacterium Gr01-1014_56]
MDPMMMVGGFGGDDGVNLFSISVNILFGFVAGLMLFIGVGEVLAYGSTLAEQLIKLTGYGAQMAQFGFATTAAPYIVLAPLGGLAVKQLSAVRTLKSFAFFAGAVIVGVAAAFLSQGYVSTLMH